MPRTAFWKGLNTQRPQGRAERLMERRATWRGCGRPGRGRSHGPTSLDEREQWLIWIVAAIVLTLVLAAIGYQVTA